MASLRVLLRHLPHQERSPSQHDISAARRSLLPKRPLPCSPSPALLACAERLPSTITADLSDAPRKALPRRGRSFPSRPVIALAHHAPSGSPAITVPPAPSTTSPASSSPPDSQTADLASRRRQDLYQFHVTIPKGVTSAARPSRLHRHLPPLRQDGRPRVGKTPPLPSQHRPSPASPFSPRSPSPKAGVSAPL